MTNTCTFKSSILQVLKALFRKVAFTIRHKDNYEIGNYHLCHSFKKTSFITPLTHNENQQSTEMSNRFFSCAQTDVLRVCKRIPLVKKVKSPTDLPCACFHRSLFHNSITCGSVLYKPISIISDSFVLYDPEWLFYMCRRKAFSTSSIVVDDSYLEKSKPSNLILTLERQGESLSEDDVLFVIVISNIRFQE